MPVSSLGTTSSGHDQEESEGGHVDDIQDDFAASWNYFEPLPQGEGGKLRESCRGGPTAGMRFPPQSPAVQKSLMLYLQKNKVHPHVIRRPIRLAPKPDPRDDAELSSIPTLRGALRGEAPSSQCSGSFKAQSKTDLVPSLSSWSLPWAPDLPLPMAKGGPSASSVPRKPIAQRGKPSSAEMWAILKEQHSKNELIPPPTSFIEIERWTRELMTKSRYLASDLDSRTVQDVADLAMYHNCLSRSATANALRKNQQPNRVAQKRRTVAAGMTNTGRGAIGSRTISSQRGQGFGVAGALSEKESMAQTMHAFRLMSPEKLREKAKMALHAGPNRMEFLSQAANVSTASCAALHRDPTVWLYSTV